MLTINSGIATNYQYKPSFQHEDQDAELTALKMQYKRERAEWEEQKQTFEEMLSDKEAKLPKPLKATMKGGAVLAASVIGGMATGFSAKYVMNVFDKMSKSKQAKNFGKFIDNHIKTPTKNAFTSVKKFFGDQIDKLKKTSSYKSSKATIKDNYKKFKGSDFVKTVKSYADKFANNKIVKTITGAVDRVFSAIGEGVVKIYNKLAKVNYKNATADTIGVAGGISTGAVTLMEDAKKDASKAQNLGYTEEY